jgi:hypothetical protein
MPNHRARKCGPGFLRYFNGTWNEKFVVGNHAKRSTLNVQRSTSKFRYPYRRTQPSRIAVMSSWRTL